MVIFVIIKICDFYLDCLNILLSTSLLALNGIFIPYSSFLSHTSNIDNLLEGLDGVLKNWLDRLHDTESSLHIVDLWLHTLDGLHLSGDLNKWLSIIESLEDSGGEGLLDILDGGGLGLASLYGKIL